MNIVSLISREWSYEITSKLIDYYKSKTNSFLLVTKNIQNLKMPMKTQENTFYPAKFLNI